jgi:hypothetical protein
MKMMTQQIYFCLILFSVPLFIHISTDEWRRRLQTLGKIARSILLKKIEMKETRQLIEGQGK